MDSPIDNDNHSRTIIHIDLDCFYAQVEEIKNPTLKTLPLGIQQKNIVVTSNYVARKYGVKKCSLITEAKKLCPHLVLVKGEDLHDYRKYSYEVTSLLQEFSPIVERLGLDENYVDVSKLVQEKLKAKEAQNLVGNVFGDLSELCQCGCSERLKIGSIIAKEMRDKIKKKLNLSSCAGVAHNKLLAKIAGSKHKPDQQTVVFPNSAVELMLTLNSVSMIPGIGATLSEQLETINVRTVEDLQNVDFNSLSNILGSAKAKNVKDVSFGSDLAAVKSTGKPQTIGIEDSCKKISVEAEVREKLKQLLNRLLVLVSEDGRIPKTIKLTVRKFDKVAKSSVRETRQCGLNTALFNGKSIAALTESNENKIMAVIMRLFDKLVNSNKPYHVTLLGIAFTKFVERPSSKCSLTNFLKKDIEVQSVTNIENLRETDLPAEFLAASTSSANEENGELENEPLLKKYKVSECDSDKRILKDCEDCASPSRLRVADLRLNSTENGGNDVNCPPEFCEEVFNELPRNMQQELWIEYKESRNHQMTSGQLTKKSKPNSILNYFVKK